MYFFSLQVSNGEYSCYVDLKSFYSVKSSAEYLARIFALKNSGQEGSRKKAKRTCQKLLNNLPSSVSSRLLSRHYYGPLTYAASSQAPLLLSLTKESFSKAGFIWKEPFRRKLYISSLKKLFLREKNLIQLPFSFLKIEHDLSIKFVFRMIIKKPSFG